MLLSLLHGPNNEKMILKWHSYRSRSGSTVNCSWQQWTSPRTIETTYSYPLYKWVTVTIMLVHQSLAILHTSYEHVCWVKPPMVIGDMFIAGEHDHHKMGCISHQEQGVISNYFHLDVAPFVSYLIQTGSKLIPCGNQTWQLKHSRFIFPLQHPFSSGIFHCHVWLAEGKINLVAGLLFLCYHLEVWDNGFHWNFHMGWVETSNQIGYRWVYIIYIYIYII